MRRKEREVTSFEKIIAIMEKCDVCSLALLDDGYPYVIPLNFGFGETEGKVNLYFHGAGSGKKMELLQKNPNVAFSMDCSHRLITGERACDATMEYESVCGRGNMQVLKQPEEKQHALRCIMQHYTGRNDDVFSERELAAVTVLQCTVQEISGKAWSKRK